MKSTQAMRDRIRELMTDPIDDYDRAVLCVLNELEHMLNEPQRSADTEGPLLARKQALSLAIAVFRYGVSKGYGSDAIDKALAATMNVPPGPPMRPSDMATLFPIRPAETRLTQVLTFLDSIEGAGYGGMAEFEIARMTMRDEVMHGEPQPTSVLDFFSQNVDAWGAAEWFDRLAKAVREQDAAVVAGDMVTMETCRNVASSSAMRLVRDYEPLVRAALAVSRPQSKIGEFK